MSFCVFVQYLISNLRCLTTFLTCVEKLTIWEKFEFVQNIGFHHFLDVPWGTKSKKFSNRIVHFILRLIVFWWEGFYWAKWKCNWCGWWWGHKFRPQPEDQELFAKLEGIWNLPKPQVLGKIRRVTNWTKTKKGFYFLTVSCSIAFARLVSSALLLSESTWPPSRIVLGQRPATMCTLWMLYFHFKSQITPKKPSLNLPYFLSAQTKHCQHLKIFHPLKPLPTRMSSMQEYPQDFINSQETSSNLLGFYFVDKVDKDPPFLSLNRCLPMLKKQRIYFPNHWHFWWKWELGDC